MRNSTENENELITLKHENKLLRQRCDRLKETQNALEKGISEGNLKQLQAEMQCMEFEQIFWAINDALWVLDDNGIVVRANEAMLELLDQPLNKVIGRKGQDLSKRQVYSDKSCQIKIDGLTKKQEYDIEINGKNQQQEYYILTVASLTTIVGSAGVVCQFKNITERRQARKKLLELNETLKQMALIDGLTQIANQRQFDESIKKEWRRLALSKEPISLLLAVIDFFKKYNDYYGHQAGDDCLRQVGKALARAALRPADLVARYGGEEFVLLLPESNLEGALRVGQRVVDSIKQLGIEHATSDVAPTVTISLGAATLIPTHNNAPAELIELADQALYRSKETGRNRITAV